MSDYFIGIDSGTQSTKTILLDSESGKVVASASAAPTGARGTRKRPGHQ